MNLRPNEYSSSNSVSLGNGKKQALKLTCRMLSAAMVAAGVVGCAVGPDYVQPDMKFAPFHHEASNDKVSRHQVADATRTNATPPLDSWWTGFNDPMLVEVVQRALAQNLDLAASFARVQQARAGAASAGAQLLPTVDFDANASAQRQSIHSPLGSIAQASPGFSRNQRDYNVGPAASWEIDLAGGLRRNAAAARDETQVAEAEQLGTRITVAADAADAYLQIRGFQARLSVALDQINTDTHLLDLVGVRQRAGSADQRAIAQAQALLRQARATVPPLRTALEAQMNRLDVLLGAQPGTYTSRLAEPASIPAVPLVDDDAEPLDVLRRRPDMIAAERRLAASSERIGAALSDYYPKISLSGALGFEGTSMNHLFSAASFQPLGAGALRWRLFDFGKVNAEVAQARGANAEALAQYRLAALKATEDVENAFTTLSQTEVRRQELAAEVDALTQARDLSQRAYKGGAITLTDVLDADRQLLTARDQLDSTRTDVGRAAISTFRALGGGWSLGTNHAETHNIARKDGVSTAQNALASSE